ncbi:MAG: Npt1/Npt2 family nucleotide transporter [Anaerolineae bacterium]
MALSSRVQPGERSRFILLALLLFINAMALESNEVVATSGFINTIGVDRIVLVWAIDMTIIVLTSGVYSLFVDRTRRPRLAVRLFMGFALVYVLLYALFMTSQSPITYAILLIINDQQWLLFPLVVWALANDMFQVSSAKRLFPLLGIAAFTGGIVGNLTAATLAQLIGLSFSLLLFNAALIFTSGLILYFAMKRVHITVRQSRSQESALDALREGLGFVREVPVYRYLTVAMILLGIGLNAIEFDFLSTVSNSITNPSNLQTFYGGFKVAVAIGLLVAQAFIAPWLLSHMGFKHIFVVMPLMMVMGLLCAGLWPGLVGVTLGNYLVRVSKVGVDEPSSRAFQGLVPDERRGRVSAFMDGYLYPIGSIIGSITIAVLLGAAANGTLAASSVRVIYLSLALLAALVALFVASRIRVDYDRSMLNWRLQRRKRGSALAGLEF